MAATCVAILTKENLGYTTSSHLQKIPVRWKTALADGRQNTGAGTQEGTRLQQYVEATKRCEDTATRFQRNAALSTVLYTVRDQSLLHCFDCSPIGDFYLLLRQDLFVRSLSQIALLGNPHY